MKRFIVTRSRLVWETHETEVEANDIESAVEAAKEQSEWELIPDSGRGEGGPVEERFHAELHYDEKTAEERAGDGAY
jgi:hypothetical protein